MALYGVIYRAIELYLTIFGLIWPIFDPKWTIYSLIWPYISLLDLYIWPPGTLLVGDPPGTPLPCTPLPHRVRTSKDSSLQGSMSKWDRVPKYRVPSV